MFKLINSIYGSFLYATKPKNAVENRTHCLACEETQNTFEKLSAYNQITAHHFGTCYIALDSLTKNALHYLMPRLLELLLLNKENKHQQFFWQVLHIFTPSNSNAFAEYTVEQRKSILHVLEILKKRFHLENYEIWDYETEKIIEFTYEKERYAEVLNALAFWKKLALE